MSLEPHVTVPADHAGDLVCVLDCVVNIVAAEDGVMSLRRLAATPWSMAAFSENIRS